MYFLLWASSKYVLSNHEIHQFGDYLNVVNQFLSIKSIKKELFNTLGIKAILNEPEFYAELENFILDEKIDAALNAIANIDDEHVSWKLANLLEKHGKFSEAFSLYQEIPLNNIHYRDANERAENLLLQSEMASPEMAF